MVDRAITRFTALAVVFLGGAIVEVFRSIVLPIYEMYGNISGG